MLETARIKFTPIRQEDLPWLIEMRTPDAVNRYLGGPEKQNPEALTKRIRDYIDWYEQSGFGVCVMELRSTGERIGTSGLQPLDDTDEIEVGYNLSEQYWRQGYGY
jgi:RimJ/RimL family protein N-acetyltransferase